MTLTVLLALALTVIVGITIAWWVTYRSMRRRMEALHRDNNRLQGEIETRMQLVHEKQDLKHELSAGLAHRATLAHARDGERLPRRRKGASTAGGQGDRNERSGTDSVAERTARSMRDALARTEQRLGHRDWQRTEALDALTEQLRQRNAGQARRDGTTASPAIGADDSASSRHRGELTLQRIVELAGMVERCTFAKPNSAATRAPDAIVDMPQDRTIAIDAEPSIEPFVRAGQANDAEQRRHEMACFAREIRAKAATLGSAPYWAQLPSRPEFIVLLVPGEQFLLETLEADPQLQTHAAQRNVIIASPTHLLALLQMIAVGWRRQTLAASVQKMREEGARLYEQLFEFTEHISGGDEALWHHVASYDRAVRALEYQLAPHARRCAESGIDPETVTAISSGAGEATRANQNGEFGAGGDDGAGSSG